LGECELGEAPAPDMMRYASEPVRMDSLMIEWCSCVFKLSLEGSDSTLYLGNQAGDYVCRGQVTLRHVHCGVIGARTEKF
jgi:hypothetical protein